MAQNGVPGETSVPKAAKEAERVRRSMEAKYPFLSLIFAVCIITIYLNFVLYSVSTWFRIFLEHQA